MQKMVRHLLSILPLHLLLWGVVWSFYYYFFSYATTNSSFVLSFSTALLPVTMVTTYTMAYYLIPHYLLQKRYGMFALYSSYVLIGTLFLIVIITFVNFIFLSGFNMREMPVLTRNFAFVFILVYIVVIMVSLVRVLISQNKTAQRIITLENSLLERQLLSRQKELTYLKQQIHPHFLFNTLNTIYGFALKQSEKTPSLILKLSQLMDYMLYQMDKPTVDIYEEIAHLEAYIGLEKVRFRDSLVVQFDTDIEAAIEIPPMLFLAFVENGFKHGNTQHPPLQIHIAIAATKNQLNFNMTNTHIDKKIKTPTHGFGIKNTKQRLQTLYPNSFSLETKKTDQQFHVSLTIDLSV
ncbi:MAG: histidine kinase [Dokdonia sp.]|nr:histidine kinase [Cytophagaceae bacterium]